jgi:hypothetical protein
LLVEWFVQYIKSGMSQLVRMETPEQAIETACALLDEGCEVSGLGMGPLANSIDQDQIARIYEIWVRAAPLQQVDRR